MIHELRHYRLKVGKLPEYLELFEHSAMPAIRRHMHLLGFWTCDTGELNHVTHLWAFEDAVRRTERYAALRADPEYRGKFQQQALLLIEHMQSQILLPVGFARDLPLGSEPDWR